jgi:hypothetical protein
MTPAAQVDVIVRDASPGLSPTWAAALASIEQAAEDRLSVAAALSMAA